MTGVSVDQFVVATEAGVATCHQDPDGSVNGLIVWARGESCVIHVPPGVLSAHFERRRRAEIEAEKAG